MNRLVADTHAALWYLGQPDQLSAAASAAMIGAVGAGGMILVASITLVEVAYQVEKSRVDPGSFGTITRALDDPASRLSLVPLDRDVAETLRRVSRSEIPDMPDRIIAATALHLGLPVVSRVRKLRASAIRTIW